MNQAILKPIRHVPQTLRLRILQSKTSKEIYSLVSEASVTEFQDQATVSAIYTKFGRFNRHAPLPHEKLQVVMNKLKLLESNFSSASDLILSCLAVEEGKLEPGKMFPKTLKSQLEKLNLTKLSVVDLIRLSQGCSIRKRDLLPEIAKELLQRKKFERIPETHQVNLLKSFANSVQFKRVQRPEDEVSQLVACASHSVQHLAQLPVLKLDNLAILLNSLGKLQVSRDALPFAFPDPALTAISPPKLWANWILGMSYFPNTNMQEISLSLKSRRLNTFDMVDLFKIYLSFLRTNTRDVEFESRFFQLLRNRKPQENAALDWEFHVSECLELIQRIPPNDSVPSQLFDTLGFMVKKPLVLSEISSSQLVSLLESFRMHRHRDEVLFHQIAEECAENRPLSEFTDRELVCFCLNVAWFEFSKSGPLVQAILSKDRMILSPALAITQLWSLALLDLLDEKQVLMLEPQCRDNRDDDDDDHNITAVAPSVSDMKSQLAAYWPSAALKPQWLAAHVPPTAGHGKPLHPELKNTIRFFQDRYTSEDVAVDCHVHDKMPHVRADIFIKKLNLVVIMDRDEELDSKLEHRLGLARFQRKLFRSLGFSVLNMNRFMLDPENLNSFLVSLESKRMKPDEQEADQHKTHTNSLT